MAKRTNYGEPYNSESMYGTIRESLLEGKSVKVGGREHSSLISVMIMDADFKREQSRILKSKALEVDGILIDSPENIRNFKKAVQALEEAIAIKQRVNTYLENKKSYKSLIEWLDMAVEVIKEGALPKHDIQECYNVAESIKDFYYDEMFGDGVNINTKKTYDHLQNICLFIGKNLDLGKSK